MTGPNWKVLPHDPIEQLEPGLWRVEGALEGMPLRRVMTIAKRSDGLLVIHNAIALEDEPMAQIESFGEPAFLVVPNGYHRLDAAAYKDRYPKLTVLCPRGARAKVERVVAVDGDYTSYPADDAVRLETVEGVGDAEGVMIVRSGGSTTLVFNDLLFNMPHGSGFNGAILRYITQSTGGPKVSRVGRWLIIKDAKTFRRELERLASTPDLRRIIVSHHEVIDHDAARVLREVAATL